MSGDDANDPEAVDGAVTGISNALISDGLTPIDPENLTSILGKFQ